MTHRFRILGILIICSSAFLFSLNAKAIASNQALGITVSPAFQQVSIPENDSQQTVKFTITNDKSTPQSLSLSVADFNTLNESGGLFFVGTNPTALQKKYGLAKWVNLPVTNIVVPSKQTISVQANILNLPSLAEGGHYGALMIVINNSKTGNGLNNVGLNPIASSLLFVTKLGAQVTHELSLENVSYGHNLIRLPSGVALRFQNVGNTHLVPRGVVTVADPRGKIMSKGIINENSGIILPQTDRQFKVNLHKISNSSIPGKYKLLVSYSFDGYNGFRIYQSSFYILGNYGVAAAVLAIMLLAIFSYMKIKVRLIAKKLKAGKADSADA